jgi:hypothetical protein
MSRSSRCTASRSDGRAQGEVGPGRVFFGLVGHDDNPADPLRSNLAGQPRDGQSAVDRLTTGHRDGIVEQQFVGDVDVGGDRRPNRQNPGMSVGAVSEIGENMRRFRERRLANPRHAFPAHLGKRRRRPIHELGQVMAPDAGERPAAFGHLGRGVVRAPRAEIRGAAERHDIAAELAFLCFQKCQALRDPR